MIRTGRHILPLLLAVQLLLLLPPSCSKTAGFDRDEPERMRFALDIGVPGMELTRSSVSGNEGVYAMQMLCFDDNGLYIGLGSVVLTPGMGSGSLSGRLTGSVPSATVSIHFIANAGLVPTDGWRNKTEAEIVGNLRSNVSNTHIVYWGHHAEASVADMGQWLMADPSNSVDLLRDRAKVTIEAPDPSWNHSSGGGKVEHIVSARFVVCNGLSSGFVAPYDRQNLCFSYNAPVIVPQDAVRYQGSASEFVDHDGAQFLFEDENSSENPVKLILETTYETVSGGVSATSVKYHQILMMRNDFSLHLIRRNHRYHLVIVNLPSSVAYDTFEEALEGNPSNNQTMYVQEVIPGVSTGEYALNVEGGTNHLFRKETGGDQYGVIGFTYLKNGEEDPSVDASNFSAVWLSNKYVAYPDTQLTIEKAAEPGRFLLTVHLYQPITSDLKTGKLLLLDKMNGLARFINVYSITGFDLGAVLRPTGDAENPYQLDFSIPDDFPLALLPVRLRMATEDFIPTSSQNAEKALGIVVSDTQGVIGTGWNYWYTYDADRPGGYSVLLKRAPGSTGSGRLFLNAEYFGILDADGEVLSDYILLEL